MVTKTMSQKEEKKLGDETRSNREYDFTNPLRDRGRTYCRRGVRRKLKNMKSTVLFVLEALKHCYVCQEISSSAAPQRSNSVFR